jgi:hypothetical protein
VSRNLRVLPVAEPHGTPCTIAFDGEELPAVSDEPLAVALFASGRRMLARSTKFHRPRGAFCFDGHCGECLIRVDGNPNVRSFMVPVREGLVCAGQNAFPSTELDALALALADWLFPGGMDHHAHDREPPGERRPGPVGAADGRVGDLAGCTAHRPRPATTGDRGRRGGGGRRA